MTLQKREHTSKNRETARIILQPHTLFIILPLQRNNQPNKLKISLIVLGIVYSLIWTPLILRSFSLRLNQRKMKRQKWTWRRIPLQRS
jgi:hypothetical protein